MTVHSCPECQNPLPADAPAGLCPRCLMKRGLGSDTSGTTAGYTPFAAPSVAELAVLFPQLEIIALLGQGGMGAVYKARQPGLDRLVALKIMPPAADASFAERFTREARTLAKLNHPGIVTIFDFGQAGNFYYFVMEFVEGVNLRQAQQAHKLTPAEALAIVPKICEALQVAHDAGVVHRDIKPENILLDAKGRVKIADFGLAKLLHRGPEQSHLTGTNQAMGTLHYMAPEQWEKPLTVDHRADIYSLGVVFYELLTGELPLGRFAPPSKIVQIDVRLDDVVLRTLEKEPNLRYQKASAVKQAVEKIAPPNVDELAPDEIKAEMESLKQRRRQRGEALFKEEAANFRKALETDLKNMTIFKFVIQAVGVALIPGFFWAIVITFNTNILLAGVALPMAVLGSVFLVVAMRTYDAQWTRVQKGQESTSFELSGPTKMLWMFDGGWLVWSWFPLSESTRAIGNGIGLGLNGVFVAIELWRWYSQRSKTGKAEMASEQLAANPPLEARGTSASALPAESSFVSRVGLPVFGFVILIAALIGLTWLYDQYVDGSYFDGPTTILTYMFIALQIFAILWFLEWVWGIITKALGHVRSVIPWTLATCATLVCMLGAANVFAPWYVLTTQHGQYWVSGINLNHNGAGVALSGVFLALGLFLFATAQIPQARRWRIGFNALAGIGLVIATVYGINRLRGEPQHLMTAELIRVLGFPASGANQPVYHVHPSFGPYAVAVLAALLVVIAVVDLRTWLTRPNDTKLSAPPV